METIVISKFKKVLLTLVVLATVTACGSSNNNDANNAGETPLDTGFTLAGCADDNSCASNPPTMIGGDRPAMVQVPSDYDISTRYPLVMVLHGRGANGFVQTLYFSLFDRVDSRQFVLLYPDGLTLSGSRQWRFRPTCCDTPEE
jgi:poly(3-hydroxybutyrate) depolymerase